MYRRILAGFIILSAMVLLCLERTPLGATEDGPSFRILQPLPGQTIAEQFPITVAFQSVDDSPIVRVDAYLDSTWCLGGRVRNPIPAGSFQVDCDLGKIKAKPGAHTLYVTLVDGQGRAVKREQQIVLTTGVKAEEHTAPRVRILEPANGAQLTKAITIRLDATDDTGIEWVCIYINGEIRAMMNEPPYQMVWDPTKEKAINGTCTVRVRALDTFGNEGLSELVTITVANRPNGRTTLEGLTPPPDETVSGDVFPALSAAMPSGGPRIARSSASNVVPPLTEWLAAANSGQPNLQPSATRENLPLFAAGDTLAVLPPKALPELQLGERIHLESTGLAPAPPLAMTASALPRLRLGAPQPTLQAAPLLLPLSSTPSSRKAVEIIPTPFSAVLPPEKGAPPTVRVETIYAMVSNLPSAASPAAFSTVTPRATVHDTASPAPRVYSQPITGHPAARRKVSVHPVLVAFVPESMLKLAPHTASNKSTEAQRGIPEVAITLTPAATSESWSHPAPASDRMPRGASGTLPSSRPPSPTIATGTPATAPMLICSTDLPNKRQPGASVQPALAPAKFDQAVAPVTPAPGERLRHTPSGSIAATIPPSTSAPAPAAAAPAARTATTGAPRTGAPALPSKAAPTIIAMASGTAPVSVHTAAPGLPTLLAGRLRTTPSAVPTRPTLQTSTPSLASGQPAARSAIGDVPRVTSTGTPAKTAPAFVPAQPRSATSSRTVPRSVPMLEVQAPYTTRPGDTLVKIAKANATTPDTLRKLNPGLSPERPLPPDTRLVVPQSDVHIYVDNHPLSNAPAPFINSGYTMMPFRKIVEAKHGVVIWLPKTHEINAWANETFMGVKIGERLAYINDEPYLLPIPARITDQRAMVPLRYLMAALKMRVEYNSASGTYYLVSQAAP